MIYSQTLLWTRYAYTLVPPLLWGMIATMWGSVSKMKGGIAGLLLDEDTENEAALPPKSEGCREGCRAHSR